MGAALELYCSTYFPKKRTDVQRGKSSKSNYYVSCMKSLFTGAISLCILNGVFTVVLFKLLTIYLNRCLSLGNYVAYTSFRTATASYAKWGFRSFLTSCTSFVVSFCLSLYSKILTNASASEEEDGGQPGSRFILTASIMLAIFASYHIQQILGLATNFIFIS